MSQDYQKFENRSANRLDDSATRYEEVDVSAADYEPATPFRAVHIGTGGDLEITGLDGVKVTMSDVPAGVHAFAGLALHTSETTATGITALF